MLPALPPPKLQQLNAIAERLVAANRIGIKVGMVLAPLLFGGIGLGLWAVIPAPFGLIVGGSIAGAGLLFLLFLLWYDRKTARGRPYMASVVVGEWHRIVDDYGGEVLKVTMTVQQAAELTPSGYGATLDALASQTVTRVVTSRGCFGVGHPGAPLVVLCMATGEVVAVDDGRQVLS